MISSCLFISEIFKTPQFQHLQVSNSGLQGYVFYLSNSSVPALFVSTLQPRKLFVQKGCTFQNFKHLGHKSIWIIYILKILVAIASLHLKISIRLNIWHHKVIFVMATISLSLYFYVSYFNILFAPALRKLRLW